MDTANRCPADIQQIAEAYCLGTLPPSEGAIFEDHYLTCARCSSVLEGVDQYVRAMQTGARELRETARTSS